MDADVIVVGLGGMGSAAAHHLAARGVRVLGLEQFGPAHDRGSSHGDSRVIRQSYFEDPAYVPLLLRSYELWDELAAESGEDLLVRTGGLLIGRPECRTVAGSLESARTHGLPHELLDAAAVRERFPTLAVRPGEVALHEAAAGFVRPERTVAAQLRLAARHGADLRFDTRVTAVHCDGAGVRVCTDQETHTAARLVVAPGAWAPQLLADLGVPLVVERQVQFWFDPVGGTRPFEPARQPVFIWEDADGTQVYAFPALDGPDGGVKAAFFRRGTPAANPAALQRTVHPDEVAVMADRVGRLVPTLPGRFRRAVACMYTNTPDEHFVIAPHPQAPQVTVACGFSGHGFKFVPVVGEVIADLALTGGTRHSIALFDPARFTGAPAGSSTPAHALSPAR